MKYIHGTTIDKVYPKLIDELLKSKQVKNTREIENCVVEVKHPNVKKICFKKRKISFEYANAELQWYWTGDNDCKNIGSYAKMWLRLSDDGIHNNSAYGYILQSYYTKDQIQEVIRMLELDKDSRRAVLNISVPYLDKINTKDFQCTIAVQFLIRNNKLNETVFMRSNDVILGFPYDYIYFISLGQFIADSLGIKLGTYTHHATSLHLYDSSLHHIIDDDSVYSINMKQIKKWYETKEKLPLKGEQNEK